MLGDATVDQAGGPITFAQMPFDHPLYIMYSSGTTGVPKCIVHGAGGTLLKHLEEHVLQANVNRGDRLFYFTTCGWMMWNWLVSGLAAEATLVLYDGSPFHPGPEHLFDYIDAHQINIFGTSAKYIDAVKNLDWYRNNLMGSLRFAPCYRQGRRWFLRVLTSSMRLLKGIYT